MRKFFNNLGNLFMKPLLRSPLHGLVSKRLMLISFTGRKSGKTYTTPVEYHQQGDCISVLTRKERVWWKNLRGGAPVTLRLRGHDVRGQANVESDNQAWIAGSQRQLLPGMSEAQAAELLPNLVLVQIELT